LPPCFKRKKSCNAGGRISEAAHRRWGTVPWAELAAPAARLAREGVELTPAQAYLHRILDGLLRHSPEGDAMYGAGGRAYREGERFRIPELGETLDRIAGEGVLVLYTGDLAERIVDHVRDGGGALSFPETIERLVQVFRRIQIMLK